MEKKQTALDILFQEIKESKAIMPNALFGYFEIVYNKVKAIEKQQIMDAYMDSYGNTTEPEDYYNQMYGK
jgi:hypothetical protein